NDTYGQLGNGNTGQSLTAVQVSGLTHVIAIAAGLQSGLALKSDGTVWAWGENNYGQLGNGTTTNSSTPVQVSGVAGAAASGAGAWQSLYATSNGTPYAAGRNQYGQLGNNTTTDTSTPTQTTNLALRVTADISYSYNGNGLRAASTISGLTTNYTWDPASALP